jgi:hypothetical protein
MIRKDLIIAILATFCLTALLFTIPLSSSGIWPYNSWWDVNNDGTVDTEDLARVSGAFGTYGDSTKNVNIANHTTYEQTYWFTIGALADWTLVNSSRGFETVDFVVGVQPYYTHVTIDVSFTMQGSGGQCSYAVENIDLYNEYHGYIKRTYNVAGSAFYAHIINHEAQPEELVVGIYMST